jgi:uncharacterized membrane protein (DUF2068 family)
MPFATMPPMEDTAKPQVHLPRVKLEPLRWIGGYKLVKASMSLFMALVVLRWTHRDLPEVAAQWMERLHITTQSKLGHFISEKVILVHSQSLRRVAIVLFIYTGVTMLEGIGLLMRKTWAEWLTVVTTAGLIPVEVHELAKRFTWVRLTILLLNIGVVIYLVLRLKRDHARRAAVVEAGKPQSAQTRATPANQESRGQ